MPYYKASVLDLAGTLIGGITKQSASNQGKVAADIVAGIADPIHIAINEIKSGFMFTTYSVRAALLQLGYSGLGISSGGSPVYLYELLYNDDGSLATGSVHRRLKIANGRAFGKSISCAHRQDATLDIEVMAISADGVTDSLTIDELVAAPTALDAERHTLGACKAGAIQLGCLTNFQLDFGLQVESQGCTSDVLDTQISINERKPKTTITTKNAPVFSASNIPQAGKACTHANTTLQLRKRLKGTASFVASGTTEHIKITSNGMLFVPKPFDAQANNDGTVDVEIHGSYDGTNTPLVFLPSSAYAATP